MAWQETPLTPDTRIDADTERELRLVAQARAGAGWALSALIARYQPAVVRYLVRLTGDPVQARALAERIFRRMERRIRGPHGGEYLRLWLLRACTEAGLDVLRHPAHPANKPMVGAPNPAGLLAERVHTSTQRLREELERIAERTDSTRRQVRQLIWSTAPQPALGPRRPRHRSQPLSDATEATPPHVDPDLDSLDPREAVRHRMMRVVLSELPYGDAQCLALHLIAGLNQAEVARALGIRPSAARHRIVVGLDRFTALYDRALEDLGISKEFGYGETAQSTEDSDSVAHLDDATAPFTPHAASGSGMPSSLAPERTELAEGAIPAPAYLPFTGDASSEESEESDNALWHAATATHPAPDVAATTDDIAQADTVEVRAATIPQESEDAASEEPAVSASSVRVLDAPPIGPVIDTVAIASTLTVLDDEQPPRDERDLAFEYSPEPWSPEVRADTDQRTAPGSKLADEGHTSIDTLAEPASLDLRSAPSEVAAPPVVEAAGEAITESASEPDAPEMVASPGGALAEEEVRVVPVRTQPDLASIPTAKNTVEGLTDHGPEGTSGIPSGQDNAHSLRVVRDLGEPAVVPIRSQQSTPLMTRGPRHTTDAIGVREVPVRSPSRRR